MTNQEFADLFSKHIPGHARLFSEFFGPAARWMPHLKPVEIGLERRISTALPGRTPASIRLIRAIDLDELSQIAESAFINALMHPFDATPMQMFHDEAADQHRDAPDHVFLSALESVYRTFVMTSCTSLGRSLKGHVSDARIEAALNAYHKGLFVVFCAAAIALVNGRHADAAMLRPYLDLCASGWMPIGVDPTANTAVVLVGG